MESLSVTRIKSVEILEALLRNENVSRWDVHIHRNTIRELVREEGKYNELYDEVESLIESAKESL